MPTYRHAYLQHKGAQTATPRPLQGARVVLMTMKCSKIPGHSAVRAVLYSGNVPEGPQSVEHSIGLCCRIQICRGHGSLSHAHAFSAYHTRPVKMRSLPHALGLYPLHSVYTYHRDSPQSSSSWARGAINQLVEGLELRNKVNRRRFTGCVTLCVT